MHFINKINSSKRSWKSQSVSTLRPIANVRRRARCSNKSFLYFQPWTPQSSIAISCVFHQPGSFESPKWSPYINWILYYGSWKKRSDAEIITSFFACLVFLVFVRLLGNQQKKVQIQQIHHAKLIPTALPVQSLCITNAGTGKWTWSLWNVDLRMAII